MFARTKSEIPEPRPANGAWVLREWNDPGAEIDLASLRCRLRIAEVHAKVTFGEQGRAEAKKETAG